MSLTMPQQRRRAAADGLGELALRGLQRRIEQQLGHADHAVHRRADLMTHVREKIGLRAAGGGFRVHRGKADVLGLALCRDILHRAVQPRDDAVACLGDAHDARPKPLAAAGDQRHGQVVGSAVLERFAHRLFDDRDGPRARRNSERPAGSGGSPGPSHGCDTPRPTRSGVIVARSSSQPPIRAIAATVSCISRSRRRAISAASLRRSAALSAASGFSPFDSPFKWGHASKRGQYLIRRPAPLPVRGRGNATR